ncbi:uncharacterized protein LOC141860275 isoform X2 [Acropora palmata]|uniref:uncharacterized protein LOC141860275 isoform X2 n=1 Tax=Acropora palmata TaxID=6131 RepID=UPI003DA1B012
MFGFLVSRKLQVMLESGKVVRYKYLKEHSEISSRDEVPRCEQKAFDLLRKENSKKESRIYLQDINDEACSKDEDSAFPELQDVASHEETNTKDDESDFPDPHDFEKAWGEDEIEDVLEKQRFEYALKELQQNQEKLLKNQNAIQKSLTAIEALLNKRFLKRKQALEVVTLPSVPARPSSSNPMTPLPWQDSIAPLVSRMSAPPVTPPSSQMAPLNHSNSTGVEENPCFSSALYNQSPPDIMSNEDA